MTSLQWIDEVLSYGAAANDELFVAAQPLADDRLDHPFPIGPGSLRAILLHTVVGEEVWLERWRGRVEQPWGDERARPAIAELQERARRAAAGRREFAATLSPADLERVQTYRDSRGSLFTATLAQMITQGLIHSIHHRAQAANVLRQLGVTCPDMDYMMHVRRPA